MLPPPIDVYEVNRPDFAEPHLVSAAERDGDRRFAALSVPSKISSKFFGELGWIS